MSLSNRFDYSAIVGMKVDSIYFSENGGAVESLIFNLGNKIFTVSMRNEGHDYELELYTIDEWIRYSEGQHIDPYYPYDCFLGEVIKNIRLFDKEKGEPIIELSFVQEDRKLSIAKEYNQVQALDLDIVRPGFTVDFGNKSIEEVDALVNGISLEESNYTTMTREVRAIYYYYSCVENIYELAAYIFNVLVRNGQRDTVSRASAYQLAQELMST